MPFSACRPISSRPNWLIPALVLALFQIPVHAGQTRIYFPIHGSGYTLDQNGQPVYFSTDDGEGVLDYDADDLQDSSLFLSTGSAGFSAATDQDFEAVVFARGVNFQGQDDDGETISFSVMGVTGPLNSNGNPESIAGLGGPVSFGADFGGHGGFAFQGLYVPEPGSLVLMGVGMCGMLMGTFGRKRIRAGCVSRRA